jgi:hypothetical protein
MKILLAFTPFHPPTSPPFGLACLKAALAEARPEVQVKVVDWNLALFRRWLLGDPPHLCDEHPDHLLGQVCPNLLVADGQGQEIWGCLTRIPATEAEANDYMTAARLLDDFYRTLATFYYGLLVPLVESKADLPASVIDRLFAAELNQIEAERPDLLGFSVMAEQNLLYSVALGLVAKARFRVPIALGGAMMSHLDPSELLCAFPWVDFVFWGEGEKTIVDFVGAWHPARNAVRGLGHRTNKGNPCLHPQQSPPDLSELPFADFSDYPLTDYLVAAPVLPISTCRGCYWGKCAFCSHTRPYGPDVRVRPAARVVDEMEYQMKRHGLRHFLFVDEAIAPKALGELSREISIRRLDIRWGTEGVRVERQFDMRLLSDAHRAGLRWVYVGVESATQRLLDLMEKGTDLATIHEFIRTCQKVGITPQLSYIHGIPSTTRDELMQEIDFLRRYPVDSSMYVLLLGSPMQQRPQDFGIRIEDQQVLFHTSQGSVHAPRFHFTVQDGLSPELADQLVETIGSRKRMRPHLGEIHAVLLAGTDFFATEVCPPDPEAAPQHAFANLEAHDQRDLQWTLHAAGCLEALGDLQGAVTILEGALGENHLSSVRRGSLILHLAAVLNRADHPELVLSLVRQAHLEKFDGPALRSQLVRAYAALGCHSEVIAHGQKILDAGYEIAGIYDILGTSYENLGHLAKALEAYRAAEMRDWSEPEINRAQARCLAALKNWREAGKMEAKAKRKESHLGRWVETRIHQ